MMNTARVQELVSINMEYFSKAINLMILRMVPYDLCLCGIVVERILFNSWFFKRMPIFRQTMKIKINHRIARTFEESSKSSITFYMLFRLIILIVSEAIGPWL